MSSITAIIIDDEKHCIGSLEILLKEYVPSVRLAGSTQDPTQGMAMIEELHPDLVFLDIAMPEMNSSTAWRSATLKSSSRPPTTSTRSGRYASAR